MNKQKVCKTVVKNFQSSGKCCQKLLWGYFFLPHPVVCTRTCTVTVKLLFEIYNTTKTNNNIIADKSVLS